jgi:N-acetyl-gamma-glutamyl-phosphate reductase
MGHGKRLRASVIGGSGYGGVELIRRLLVHPEVELALVASVDFVDEPLGAAHPSLEGVPLTFQKISPREAAAGMDIVLLALPHKVTADKVPEIADGTRAKVVDMSGDHRLKDSAAYARWYGHAHPFPERMNDFVYGLPELHRERIRASRFVASPGCFATTIELSLLPLARAGLLRGLVYVQGITGSSGSGVAPSGGTHHPVRANNLRTYKPLEHQHIPEILEALADAGAPEVELRFVPVSGPLSRGIFTTTFVELPEEWTEARLRMLYEDAYAAEPFVRVPRKRLPEVAAVSNSNYAEVGIAAGAVHEGTRTVAVFGATDNLVKGGAGQAIQNMNLMLGLPETLSLEDRGPWPP